MAGELERASLALNERKRALLGMDAIDSAVHDTDASGVAMLLSGFDLDRAELEDSQNLAAHLGITMLRSDPSCLPEAFAAIFVDGLAMGLLVAQQRAKAVST